MPTSEFYSTNENRAYPLVDRPATFGGHTLPLGVILDVGLLYGIEADFDQGLHYVRLTSIAKSGTNVVLTFSTDATVSATFVFSVPQDETWGATRFVDANGGGTYGTAFVVTGDVAELYNALPAGDATYTADGVYPVEPSTVQTLKDTFVRSVNAATNPRTQWAPPAECAGASAAADYVVTLRNKVGRLLWYAGYNTRLQVDQAANEITIGAREGDGAGVICGDPIFVATESSEGGGSGGNSPVVISVGADGSLRCADVIHTINGVGPNVDGSFFLFGGPGILIEAYPDDHKLVLNFEWNDYDRPYCKADAD